MIDYRSQGALPRKPHTAFRGPDGALLYEHCHTRQGFDGPFSILYHERPPQNYADGIAVPALWPTPIEAPGASV